MQSRPILQRLYGARVTSTTSAPPAPDAGGQGNGDGDGEEEDPILCSDSSIDAMATVSVGKRRRTYVFKDDLYWRLTNVSVEAGYPRKISSAWRGVPDNLDAVLVYSPRGGKKEILFFFKVTCTLI